MDPTNKNILFHDPNSLIVINKNGRMRQVFTPFTAQVMIANSAFEINSWVYIEEVLPHEKYRIIYRIGNQCLPYFVFRLTMKF